MKMKFNTKSFEKVRMKNQMQIQYGFGLIVFCRVQSKAAYGNKLST